jgi:hypothetical protein
VNVAYVYLYIYIYTVFLTIVDSNSFLTSLCFQVFYSLATISYRLGNAIDRNGNVHGACARVDEPVKGGNQTSYKITFPKGSLSIGAHLYSTGTENTVAQHRRARFAACCALSTAPIGLAGPHRRHVHDPVKSKRKHAPVCRVYIFALSGTPAKRRKLSHLSDSERCEEFPSF